MLFCCESKCGLKGNMILFWNELGEQLPKENRSTKMWTACVVERSILKVMEECWREVRSTNASSGTPKEGCIVHGMK